MTKSEADEDDIYMALSGPEDARMLGFGSLQPAALRGPQMSDMAIAVLFRQIASASYETLWFTRRARRVGLVPVIIEHRTDRFCSRNSFKCSLTTPSVAVGRDRHGRPIVKRTRLVEHAAAEGRRLQDLVTQSGETLVAYHHRRLLAMMGRSVPRIVDLSSVVRTASAGPRAYYVDLFSLMTGRAALFEDFVIDEQTASFYRRVVKPAYEEAATLTGHRAQVARLIPGRRAASPLWNAYPALRSEALPSSTRTSQHVCIAS